MSSERWVLAPYVRVGFEKTVLCFGFGSHQVRIECQLSQRLLLELAAFCRTPRTIQEAREFLWQQSRTTRSPATGDVIDFLTERSFLVPASAEVADRYSRHALFYRLYGATPKQVQDRLARSTVMVLGCGGIGNHVAVALATAGIGRLVLVDPDTVELSNLTRQFMFSEADVGARKVDALRRAILERNSECRVDTLSLAIGSAADLQELPACSFIVASADRPRELIYWLNRYCIEREYPFINIGYIQDIAVWGPLVVPGVTGCMACRSFTAGDVAASESLTSLVAEINSVYQAPSASPVNSLAAAAGSLDVLRFLGGFGEPFSLGRRVGLWTTDFSAQHQVLTKNDDCEVCSTLSSREH